MLIGCENLIEIIINDIWSSNDCKECMISEFWELMRALNLKWKISQKLRTSSRGTRREILGLPAFTLTNSWSRKWLIRWYSLFKINAVVRSDSSTEGILLLRKNYDEEELFILRIPIAPHQQQRTEICKYTFGYDNRCWCRSYSIVEKSGESLQINILFLSFVSFFSCWKCHFTSPTCSKMDGFHSQWICWWKKVQLPKRIISSPWL